MEPGLKGARPFPAAFFGIFACCFLFPPRAPAQVSQNFYSSSAQLNSLDNAALSARAAAMGSAFTGVADDASALFANPAGLAWLTKGEISLNSHLGLVDTLQETLVVALPSGRWGSFALAGSYLDYGTMEGRDSLGSLAPSYSANRLGLQAGWGIKILGPLSLGAALRYSQQSVMGTGSSALVPEVGLLWIPLKDLRLGLDYGNAGWNSIPGTLDSFLKFGSSYRFRLDQSFQLLAALGDSIELNSLNYVQTGVEASWHSQYFLRAGYQSAFSPNDYGGFSGFSFGGGLALAGFALDYAYLPYGDLGNTHRFSVTYTFETLERASEPPSGSKTAPGRMNSSTGVKDGTKPGNFSNANPASFPSQGAPSPAGPVKGDKGISAGASAPLSTATSNPPGSVGEGGTSTNSTPPQGPGTPTEGLSSDRQSPSNSRANAPTTETSGTQDSLNLTFDIPPDYVAKGDGFESQGLHSEAILSYQKAIRQDSQNVLAWSKLANLYARLGRKDYAIPCFEKVLQLRPDNEVLRTWLANYKVQKP